MTQQFLSWVHILGFLSTAENLFGRARDLERRGTQLPICAKDDCFPATPKAHCPANP
jgi:hypothetical protein